MTIDADKLRALEAEPGLQSVDDLKHYLYRNRADILAQADRIALLEGALRGLRDLPIQENDGPNALHLGGESFQGPAVDWAFDMVRKIKAICTEALGTHP